MAKIKGPLFSLKASGSIGPRLTYSQRKSGPQVRFQRPNTDAKSTVQIKQRGFFTTAMGWWHELNDAEKDEWLVLGRIDC